LARFDDHDRRGCENLARIITAHLKGCRVR
jgi:hypothetical protein